MTAFKKCYACGKMAVAKFFRKFESSGMIRDVNSCEECVRLDDKNFELKRKNNRKKKDK